MDSFPSLFDWMVSDFKELHTISGDDGKKEKANQFVSVHMVDFLNFSFDNGIQSLKETSATDRHSGTSTIIGGVREEGDYFVLFINWKVKISGFIVTLVWIRAKEEVKNA